MGGAPQEHPQGTVILVLGILGFVTVICGVIAWVLGSKAQKEIAASGQHYSNEGNIRVGKILGIVTTVLGIIYLAIILIVVIASMAMVGSSM
jgi:hypothetical protein